MLYTRCALTIIVLCLYLLTASSSSATVIFTDDFEYSSNASTCAQMLTLTSPSFRWTGCKDDSTEPPSNGYVGISNLHAHGGVRAALHHFNAPPGNYTDIYFDKSVTVGQEVWIQMWVYLARETGMMSEFHCNYPCNDMKWLYLYATPQGPPNLTNCLMMGGDENYIYPPNWTVNGQFPDWHTGVWLQDHTDCADKSLGENLYTGTQLLNNVYYVPVNTWTNIAWHVSTNTAANPNTEIWLNHGTGLVKVASYNYHYMDGQSIGRIKLGTTWMPQAWVFTDDLIIATSQADLPIFGSSNHLEFTTQPAGCSGGTVCTTQPVVTAKDSSGNTVTSFNGNVTFAIGNNPSGGILSGTVTVTAVSGIATATNLSIDKSGINYNLTASASGYPTATSSSFNVTVGAANKLAVVQQPSGGSVNQAWTTQPNVAVQDAGGNTVTTATNSITAALQTCSGILTFTTNPLSATNGIASFAGGRSDTVGTNCFLRFTATGLTQIDSSTFNITASTTSTPGRGIGGPLP